MIKGLFDSFSKVDKSSWQTTAQKELKDQAPLETLFFTLNNIHQAPYYDSSDQPGTTVGLTISSDPFLGPRSWHNMPSIGCNNVNEANAKALEHLNQGADGILFEITSEVDLGKLLAGIELPYCTVAFVVDNDHSPILVEFAQHVNRSGYQIASINGGIFWKKIDAQHLKSNLKLYESWTKFRPIGLSIPHQSDPTAEISHALVSAFDLLQQLGSTQPKLFFDKLSFSFSIESSFFIEIAKLKAIRGLWDQIAGAYGMLDTIDPLPIHGRSHNWINERYLPNENMIRSTTAALSAVLGGCDFITIDSDDSEGQFKNRIARNVLTILREESRLNITADPTAGSYYLDALVDQLSKEAWNKFQEQINS